MPSHVLMTIVGCLALLVASGVSAQDLSFTGNWESTYGAMRLEQQGTDVTGTYSYAAGSRIVGTVTGARLTFRYTEPDAAGDGWFELSDDGDYLAGQWRQDGGGAWQPWTASRVGADPQAVWLYVVEAYWEESLAEPEYAFGDMLRAWFERYPHVEVRHRRVRDGDDLRSALEDATYLPGPTAVWVASHGSNGELAVGPDHVPAADVGRALAGADQVFAVHFSSCEMGVDGALEAVRRPLRDDAVVTGYAVSVDWSASALVEIAYLDLIVGRRIDPVDAVAQVLRELPMAGDTGVVGSPFSYAALRMSAGRTPP